MNSIFRAPSTHIRPLDVHFLYDGHPTYMMVLAKSHSHALQVLFRYFELYNQLEHVTFDPNDAHCYVADLLYFSDSLYKHLKQINHGNN